MLDPLSAIFLKRQGQATEKKKMLERAFFSSCFYSRFFTIFGSFGFFVGWLLFLQFLLG